MIKPPTKAISVILFLFAIYILTACFALPVEEHFERIPTVAAPVVQPFRTITVGRGEVVGFEVVHTSYMPGNEEVLRFKRAGLPIQAIYVEVGDTVTAGQLIASLYDPYLSGQLAPLLREQEWIQLNLSQLQARHDLALSEASITNMPIDDTDFRRARTRFLFDLETIDARIEYLSRHEAERYVFASLDGVVTSVMRVDEGTVSTLAQRVAVIADQNFSAFRADSPILAAKELGEIVYVVVAHMPYRAMIVDPYEHGIIREGTSPYEVHMLVICEEQPQFTTPTLGFIAVVYDEASDVIRLPRHAFRFTNTRIFVYVLEDGQRATRDVEIGLIGNNYIEIVSGLEYGEVIIIG